MILILIGLVLGLVLGLIFNFPIPQAYSNHMAVLFITALASLTGILADSLAQNYRSRRTLYAFLGNGLISLALVILGQQLKLPLEYVVYFALGNQIYQNLNKIWQKISLKGDLEAPKSSRFLRKNGQELGRGETALEKKDASLPRKTKI